jgi:hypothetical protein
MSYQLGDVVPLSVTVRDADGSAANAGQVDLTVTLPDGTTDVTSGISPTSTGVYDHDYATTQAGRHGVRWVATGANASAYTDAFLVEPADDRDFISLAETKRHLRKDATKTSDDAELAEFIAAACAKIVDLIGPVSPATVTDEVEVCRPRRTIILDAHPVIEVTSVQLAGTPATTIDPADADAGTAGWRLADAGAGLIDHTGGWPTGTVRIAYRAGRTPVPGNVRLAALELVKHLWQTIKLNTTGSRPPVAGGDQILIAGTAYALPNRVRELLGLGKLPSSDVMVG